MFLTVIRYMYPHVSISTSQISFWVYRYGLCHLTFTLLFNHDFDLISTSPLHHFVLGAYNSLFKHLPLIFISLPIDLPPNQIIISTISRYWYFSRPAEHVLPCNRLNQLKALKIVHDYNFEGLGYLSFRYYWPAPLLRHFL